MEPPVSYFACCDLESMFHFCAVPQAHRSCEMTHVLERVFVCVRDTSFTRSLARCFILCAHFYGYSLAYGQSQAEYQLLGLVRSCRRAMFQVAMRKFG